jgi:hypothetical protein
VLLPCHSPKVLWIWLLFLAPPCDVTRVQICHETKLHQISLILYHPLYDFFVFCIWDLSLKCQLQTLSGWHRCLDTLKKLNLEHPRWCSVWDPAKIFLVSKFSYLLFSNPIYETKTGTTNRWETTNSKPPQPITMIGWSETRSSSQIIFVTLFSGRCC